MFKEVLADVFPLIEKFAPTVANALGSPWAGAVSIGVLNLLGNAFGVNPADPKNLCTHIQATSDAEGILSQLEFNFADWIKSSNVQFKMPNKAELNIKLEWDQAQSPTI